MYFSVYVQLMYSIDETANHVRCIVRTALPVHNLEQKMRVLTVVREYRQTVAENFAISERVKMAHILALIFLQLRTWMYVLGYMLAFGTILAKMWRVYQIFHNPTPNKVV